jgi:hypothetical protein
MCLGDGFGEVSLSGGTGDGDIPEREGGSGVRVGGSLPSSYAPNMGDELRRSGIPGEDGLGDANDDFRGEGIGAGVNPVFLLPDDGEMDLEVVTRSELGESVASSGV